MKTLANTKTIASVKDNDNVVFTEEKALMEFLNSVKEATTVRNVPMNLLCPKGAEFNLFADMGDFKKARVGDLDIPDVNNEAVLSCLMDRASQMFVTVPATNKWHWVPLRACSYDSLLERAELSCKGLKRTEDTSRWYSVSPEKRGECVAKMCENIGKAVSDHLSNHPDEAKAFLAAHE